MYSFTHACYLTQIIRTTITGMIDGQEITVAPVLLANTRVRPRWNKSPMRRGGRFPAWRRRSVPFRPPADRRRRPL